MRDRRNQPDKDDDIARLAAIGHEKNPKFPSIIIRQLWPKARLPLRIHFPSPRMLLVVDKHKTFLLSGTGDLIEPDDGIIGIGSGGAFAQATFPPKASSSVNSSQACA